MRRMPWAILFLFLAAAAVAGCGWYKSRMLQSKKDKETITCLTYSLQTMINRPPAEVIEYMSSWDNIQRAIPRAHIESWSGDKILRVGDYARAHTNGLVANLPVNVVAVRWDPPRLLELAFSQGLHGTLRFDFTPVENQTRIKTSVHFFFLPDTAAGRTFNDLVESGAAEETVDSFITDVLRQAKAQIEGLDPASVVFEDPPRYEIFKDSYFMAEQDFPLSVNKLFSLLTQSDNLGAIMPFGRIEALDQSPASPAGLGDHYRATSKPELGPPVTYDLVTLQLDAPKEARFFLYAHDVRIEWSLFVSPTFAGSKAQMLFIVDLPPEQTGPALDVIIQTNSIDKIVQQGLEQFAAGL